MESIQDTAFLVGHSGEVSLIALTINLLLAGFLCSILAAFYIKYGTSLTNRNHLAKNFLMIGVTTTLIITIVKSSLALSLGLVGALSIVRFRAAIKEPEELAFLFLAIAIGLGFGADNRVITVLAFFIILILFLIHTRYGAKSSQQESVYLTVNFSDADGETFNINDVKDIVSMNSASSSIKRYDKNSNSSEIVFVININEYNNIKKIKDDLEGLSKNILFSFVEEARVF
jgi:uncharacterized membrane protein YhiD involved in acid resistance